MNIRVVEYNPVVYIDGTEEAEHNTNKNLFLDGSSSFNPNYNTSLTYSWSCLEQDSSGKFN